MQRLRDKVAIVTGGAGGIGSAVARRLVSEGAQVVVADIDLGRATSVANELGSAALPVEYDAGDADSIRGLVEATVRHFGGLDILHNNAAVTDPAVQSQDRTAPEIPVEVWQKVLDVNLTGYLIGCKYAVPEMIKRGGGSIINTASGSGMLGDLVRVAYGTSKAGIIALTKYVATQHGRDGVRCNAIAPGVIVTQALREAASDILAIQSRHVVIKRLGVPEDIAGLVAYLASDEAGYITGQCISIDGGAAMHQPHFADFANG